MIVFVCVFSVILFCGGSKAQVNQPHTLSFVEGENVEIPCNHSITSYDRLLWYKIHRDGALELILYGYNSGDEKGPFKMTINKEKLYSALSIREEQISQSGLYYCAVRATSGVDKLIFGKGTILNVLPKTEQKDPSVYKLKSSKQGEGLPNFVCLVTDFPNPQTNLTVDGIESSLSATAVLDKSTNDVWRYSTVVWDNNNDVDCRMRYGDGNEIYPKSDPENAEETCSSLSIDASFRTNPSLNTLSQTVLGWRALTAKAIIFNLIITLRLWSS